MADDKIQKYLPDARQSTLEPRVEREYYLAFDRVYKYFEAKLNILNDTIDSLNKVVEAQKVELARQGSLVNSFATPIIGIINPTNPLASLGMGTVQTITIEPAAIFNITNASGPTTAITMDVQAKNKFLSGPITGADAIPTFRFIVAADIVGLTTEDHKLAILGN